MSNPANSSLIFVTGASRSGTTMMSRIIGAHSQIYSTKELHYFGDICILGQLNKPCEKPELVKMAAMLCSRIERGLWKSQVTESEITHAKQLVDQMPLEKRTSADLFKYVVNHYASQLNKCFVCEQTPRNIFYIKQLLRIFPDSKFVHLIRDPRAVMASQKNRWRLRGMGRNNIPLSEMLRTRANYHPWTICKLWLKATNMALDVQESPNVILIKFEDFVADPETYTRQISSFLGVEYEPQMLDIPRMGSSHKVNEKEKGISKDVVFKWRDTLNNAEIAYCEKATSRLMDKFNYPRHYSSGTDAVGIFSQVITYPIHLVGMMLANPRRAWIQLTALLGVRS